MSNRIILSLIATCFTLLLNAQSKVEKLQFVEQYKNIAVMEMQRTGMPASIKLAQACVESNYGTSTLARKANNFFGVKCGRDWIGDTYYIKDDDYDENGKIVESCFRRYDAPNASFVAHSEFLRDPNKAYRYGFLFRLDPLDYKKWAQGLYQAGYATNPNYSNLLINTIEDLQLFKFDVMTPGNVQSVAGVIMVNDAKMILAKLGDTPTDIAAKYNISLRRLLRYNEKLRGPNQPLTENSRIFIQKKRRFFRGKQNIHYVQAGETMYSISQQYGVRLSKLYCKNRMEEGTQPAVGEKVSIRGRFSRSESPKLRDSSGDEDNATPVQNNGDKLLDIDNSTVVKPSDLPEPSNTPIPGGVLSNPIPSTNSNGTNTSTPSNGNTPSNNNGTTTTPSNGNTFPDGTPIIVENPKPDDVKVVTPEVLIPKKPTKPVKKKDTTTKPSTPATTTPSTTVPTTKPSTTPTSTTPSSTLPTSKPTTSTSSTKPNTTPSTTKPTTSGTTPPPAQTIPTTSPTSSVPSTTTGATTTSAPSANIEGAVYYSVATGDTMYSVAKKFSTTVDAIKSLNNLKADAIRPGQFLRVK